ncbi:alpha/beta fold hydrolase [Paenirhodobacter sp.]|uniref:alpha/beta fold hydrolase n=1 Tax=Paenirhodobacter sp. TaxID=1965326 RepID=UPI003B403075
MTPGIHSQTVGTGDRPALAIHCMLGSAEIWTPVLTPLGDRITATTFDLPGHGQSAPWQADPAPGAYQTLATRIAAGFIDRPVDLIGHSFGASVALRIAVGAPEAIRSLTLVEPVLFSSVRGTPVWEAWSERQSHLITLMAQGRFEDAARSFMGVWGAGVPWDALPQKQRDRFTRQMPIIENVSQANFTDPADIFRPGGLEAVDTPVMLIYGQRSPEICPAVCEAIAARLPDVGVASIPGAGHMAPLTHPKQVSDLIAMNLDRS